MAAAAAAFAGALDEKQGRVGLSELEVDGARREWSYLPELVRPGLPLSALDDAQRKLAHELIAASTSMPGYAKVVSIIAMEHVRRALLSLGGATPGTPRGAADENPAVPGTQAAPPHQLFDPERYCLRIFGTPGASRPWGWQLAGHHVSLNFTVAGTRVSGTPCMLGSSPASYGTLSPLADDEEAGYRFLGLLTPAQREDAIIYHRPPPDFATRMVPRIGAEELPDHVFDPEPDYRIDDAERKILSYIRSGPKGIAGSVLSRGQLDYLMVVLAGFAGRLPDDVGASALRKAKAAGDASICFAWAGGIRPGERHYYRIQAPGLLIEHDNTQGGGKHIHSVWRDPDNDFGDDILAQHYRDHH
jgi:hypothetical protein